MKQLFILTSLIIFGCAIGFIFQSGGYSNVSIVGSIIASGSLISAAIVVASIKGDSNSK